MRHTRNHRPSVEAGGQPPPGAGVVRIQKLHLAAVRNHILRLQAVDPVGRVLEPNRQAYTLRNRHFHTLLGHNRLVRSHLDRTCQPLGAEEEPGRSQVAAGRSHLVVDLGRPVFG